MKTVVTNVTFANFKCGKDIFQFHKQGRGGSRSMGSPVLASGITLVNVGEWTKPHFNCDWSASHTFLEDVDGVLGPSTSTGPGFIVRNGPWVKSFIPPESCSIIEYSGNDCSAYCEGTCLRQVSIKPWFDGQTNSNLDFHLSNGVTEEIFLSQGFADFRIVLPQGNYHGSFFDETGTEVIASSVEVTPYQEPLCNDFVTANDFVFPLDSL